ncbi:hypothetical protein ES332_D08G249200v1 [Gossypium tomentosum]|uniref:Uncharacterized protein n=1 Tax=Gossypium tomentosum TaxID=34277 RepID=A0A5D2JYD2_GOSTO|nr:hypothetical protein ES332_D08G249200v1 [Gossypium tomentosum]
MLRLRRREQGFGLKVYEGRTVTWHGAETSWRRVAWSRWRTCEGRA